ncbi:2TM domain-containing protein [Flavobacterium algicola]|uniref:2TM domain-containing protein n=1 Tax=Flavobacterium algicola TaxID=556529 RepID=UPI001EFC38CB|nr:2TM domain-containing protein [Flavobacterium algicola]MCG9792422.1 2TM domain-containing protein [Flavobacterium algicola]
MKNYTIDIKNRSQSSDERYNIAFKRVKRIKGFYVHILVYVLVNIFLISSSISREELEGGFNFNPRLFSTPIFWGIGLVAHGLSVFGRNLFFGSNWEEKKIQEFMHKEEATKWE